MLDKYCFPLFLCEQYRLCNLSKVQIIGLTHLCLNISINLLKDIKGKNDNLDIGKQWEKEYEKIET